MSGVPEDLKTPKEAGKLLRVTAATVRRWVREGMLSGFRIGGRVFVSETQALAMVRRTGAEQRREGA